MRTFFLTSFLALFCNAFACGPGWFPNAYYYNLFDQELLSDSSLFLLLYDAEYPTYHNRKGLDYQEYLESTLASPNLVEWQKYLVKVSLPSIRYVLYQLPIDSVCPVQNALKYDYRIKDHRLIPFTFLSAEKRNAFFDYLIFAKRCEQVAHIVNHWDGEEEQARQISNMKQLIQEGRVLLEEQESSFMKLRYYFQLVRLAHYSLQFNDAVSYFNKAEELGVKNYIYYRTMEQAAGALAGLDSLKANYYFSVVFDELIDRKEIALRSIKINSDEEWRVSTRYTHNVDELAVFHMMRAMSFAGNEREEFKQIFEFNTKSIYLDVLMLRIVNQYERIFNPSENYSDFDGETIERYRQHIPELIEMCDAFITENLNDQRSQLYRLIKSYLHYLNQNMVEAKQSLSAFTPLPKYKAQHEVIQFLVDINQWSRLNAANEDEFYAKMKRLASKVAFSDLKGFYFDRAGTQYLAQKDYAKAYLCHHHAKAAQHHLFKPLLVDFKKLADKTEKSDFEKELWAKKGISENEYNELLGTWYLQHNELDSAVRCFNQIAEPEGYTALSAPFFENAIFSGVVKFPVFNAPFVKQSDSLHLEYFNKDERINKFTLATIMLELHKKAKGNGAQKRLANQMLANAWNNLHTEEWFRHVLYFEANNGSPSRFGKTTDEQMALYTNFKFQPTYFYYNTDVPLGYVKTGMQSTPNKEQQAKLAFAGMRAEVHKKGHVFKYGSYVSGKGYTLLKNGEYTYANQLMNAYQNTNFYNLAVGQCSHLELYAKLSD